jgi:hypothetical protein
VLQNGHWREELNVLFEEYELSVAYSMIAMARGDGIPPHPLQRYTCYWVAFNNIYVAIGEHAGKTAQLRKQPDGSVRTRKIAHVDVPDVQIVRERDQIDLAFQWFSDDLKRELVEHPSTEFFVYRTPHLRGQPLPTDAIGKTLNGVLNVGYTVDAKHPVWAPINTSMYEVYQKGDPVTEPIGMSSPSRFCACFIRFETTRFTAARVPMMPTIQRCSRWRCHYLL